LIALQAKIGSKEMVENFKKEGWMPTTLYF